MGDQLKARFAELQEEFPHHSSYVNFVRLMREEGVTNQAAIGRYFNKFVDKGDYAPNEKRQIFRWFSKTLINKGILATKNSDLPRHKELVASPYQGRLLA